VSGVAADRNGNVFVTGYGIHFLTVKYASSFPPVHLVIERAGSGGYFIRFNGVPDSDYRLQRAPGVNGPWSTSAPQTAPASGQMAFWDFLAPPDHAFYRTVQP
jgi:hypothetical protein